MLRSAVISCLFALSLLLGACSDEAISPEEEIRMFIDAGVEATEARSVDGLEELIHRNYLDQKGNNKKQATKLLHGLFFRHKKIFLLTRIDSIDFVSEREAIVKLKVAMAGSEISGLEALTSLRADVYAFELNLLKEDDWQLQHSKWRHASVAEFD